MASSILINIGLSNRLLPDGTKQVANQMLPNCQLDPGKQISVKLQSKYDNVHSGKCIWTWLQNDRNFIWVNMLMLLLSLLHDTTGVFQWNI